MGYAGGSRGAGTQGTEASGGNGRGGVHGEGGATGVWGGEALGDSERYDFILDSGSRLWRVQLKCTARVHSGCYEIQPMHSVYGQAKKTYTKREIDVLVVYVVPCEAWYVLPVEAFAPVRHMGFYPHRKSKKARWEKYRERWGWLNSRGTA